MTDIGYEWRALSEAVSARRVNNRTVRLADSIDGEALRVHNVHINPAFPLRVCLDVEVGP